MITAGRNTGPGRRSRGPLFLGGLVLLSTAAHLSAAPRMISYGYPNCVSCHISVQGRGLLNSYGRGIDSAQSYSKKDFTAMLLGKPSDAEDPSGNWDGRFGQALADFLVALRLNRQIDEEKTDPAISVLYRQAIFFGEREQLRVNAEIGLVDGGLHEATLGPSLAATGGNAVFLKKLLLEWRLEEKDGAGKELAVGRDYLPLGLQIDDHASYILHLNRAGIYDFPLQAKYFAWDEKSLGSAFVYAPSFEEGSDRHEYGGGFLYERYPTSKLAAGVQGLVGFGDETDRMRTGAYMRWGISEKWALLAQADYGAFWDRRTFAGTADQVATFLQLFHHHYEWLVSAVTVNYAYSEALLAQADLFSFRYTATARLNRNVTLGLTYSTGDTLRNLESANELAVFTTIKF